MREVGEPDFSACSSSCSSLLLLPVRSGLRAAVFRGVGGWGSLLINKIQRLWLLFLIGQVEPLPHSGAGDAASSRILHARLPLFLIARLCRRSEPKRRGALDTTHFPSREESGAQEQPLSLSLSFSLSLSLSRSLPHTRSRPRARTPFIRLHFAVVKITALISTASADLSPAFAPFFFDGPTLGKHAPRERSTYELVVYILCVCLCAICVRFVRSRRGFNLTSTVSFYASRGFLFIWLLARKASEGL